MSWNTPNDAICRHCENAIVYDRNKGKWVNPADETFPGVCPANDAIPRVHEPAVNVT